MSILIIPGNNLYSLILATLITPEMNNVWESENKLQKEVDKKETKWYKIYFLLMNIAMIRVTIRLIVCQVIVKKC